MGRGGRFGGKASPLWRAQLAWHGSRQPHPICSRDRTGCTEFAGSTGQSQAVDEQDQHSAFSISTSISMREGETLDAVGSWEGGKLCSINSHACLCMVYPNRDIPKGGIPNREHEHGQKDCTYCNPQRKDTARRASRNLNLNLNLNQYVRARAAFFGRGYQPGQPLDRGREASLAQTSASTQHCQFANLAPIHAAATR